MKFLLKFVKDNPVIAYIVGGIFLLWILTPIIMLLFVESSNRGTFGDMYGSVTSLFTGLAFAGLIYTINLQKTELGLQRTELTLTRKELAGQRLAIEEQNKDGRRRMLQETFFSLLSAHNQLLETIKSSRSSGKSSAVITNTGRTVLAMLYKNSNLDYKLQNVDGSADEISKKTADLYNEEIWENRSNALAGYYRSLYNLLSFAVENKSDIGNLYLDIAKDQISEVELILLLCHAQTSQGMHFRKLIDENSILQHIPSSIVRNKKVFESLGPNAYGGEYPN